MNRRTRRLLVGRLALSSWLFAGFSGISPSAVAASQRYEPVDPTGHWQGAVTVQGMSVPIAIDLARSAGGALIGTFSMPGQKLLGAPVSDISVDGEKLAFALPLTGSRFTAIVNPVNKSMSAHIDSRTAGNVEVTLLRTGDARIDAPPRSAAIGKNIEGMWTGRIDVDGGRRVELTLANHADGTSTGTLVSVDEGRLEMPVAIVQDGAKVTLTIKMVNSRYSATLNSAGSELVGVYTTSEGSEFPLTLRRGESQPSK